MISSRYHQTILNQYPLRYHQLCRTTPDRHHRFRYLLRVTFCLLDGSSAFLLISFSGSARATRHANIDESDSASSSKKRCRAHRVLVRLTFLFIHCDLPVFTARSLFEIARFLKFPIEMLIICMLNGFEFLYKSE